MVTPVVWRISNIRSLQACLWIQLVIFGFLWPIDMTAAFDCIEAERRCLRDSNCLLAMEAHRVTCGPLGTSCTSANLNLCHAALVGLQLSSAFNGSCWCHEPSMHKSVYHRCLDIHLRMFYHPCIAAINSRVNGKRREEIVHEQQKQKQREQEEEQKRRRQQEEEEERRREEWRRWHQSAHRGSSPPPLPPPTTLTTQSSAGASLITTTRMTGAAGGSNDETAQLEAIKREQDRQRQDYERQLLEQRRRYEQLIREQNERWRQQHGATTTSSTTDPSRSTSSSSFSTSTPSELRTERVVDSAVLSPGPTRRYEPAPVAVVTDLTLLEKDRRVTSGDISHVTIDKEQEERPAVVVVVPTPPRHRIRHFQDKVDVIERALETIGGGRGNGHHKPTGVVVNGETMVNGHSISDITGFFTPTHLDGAGGAKLKLSVPGEYHWSCTRSLERCLDHVACTRLLELYRERCRVENQRCVSTDWKGCKDAYEGIRWTGLNNCTCSDDHRLHGPSCHFVELLTAHNQCIDQFKRAGHITEENGAPIFVGAINASLSSSSSHPANARTSTYSPPTRWNRPQPQSPAQGGGMTSSHGRPTTPRPTIKSTTISRPAVIRPLTTSKTTTAPVIAGGRTLPSTSTRKTTSKITTSARTVKPTTTTTKKSTSSTNRKPIATIKPTRSPGIPGGGSSVEEFTSTEWEEDQLDDEDYMTTTTPTRVILFPQRYPLHPISRLPLITWEEWDKRRVTMPPTLPSYASLRKVSDREMALGRMTYRVESTCQFAYSNCHWDNTCSWQLSEIKSYCVTICDRQHCSAAISRFYKYVGSEFREGLTFCTCRPNDNECLQYQKLLFPSCLRQIQRHEWRECGDLKIECKNDDRCWPWADKYFDACRWDQDRGRCASSSAACRQAVLGIRGTPLDTDCACLPNSPECQAIQNSLYFRNPCFEEARLTMLPKFTTRRPTKATTTTTTTSTTSTTSTTPTTTPTTMSSSTTEEATTELTNVTLVDALESPLITTTVTTGDDATVRPPWPPWGRRTTTPRTRSTTVRGATRPGGGHVISATTTPRRRIRTTTVTNRPPKRRPTPSTRVVYDYYDEITTQQTEEPTSTEWNVTETTTMKTTTTTPPPTTTHAPQCIGTDQETLEYRMGIGPEIVRLYRDRFTRCSSLCQCHENPSARLSANYEFGDSEHSEQQPLDPILACHEIECMENIPCPGGTLLGYGAPVFQLNQDRCTCISGDFVCRRPPRDVLLNKDWSAGLFLSIGYSQKEIKWLVPRFPQEIGGRSVILPLTEGEFVNELMKHLEMQLEIITNTDEYACKLVKKMESENNFIFQVKLARYGNGQIQGYDYEDLDFEEEVPSYHEVLCRRPVKLLARSLDRDRFRNDVILSVIKEALVDDRLPESAGVGVITRPSTDNICFQVLILLFAICRLMLSC